MKRLAADSLRTCRSCAAKRTNERSQSASKGGKVGGRVTADSGALLLAGAQAHTPEAEARRFETLKRKGALWSSKPELSLLQQLQERFGASNVVHHAIIDGFRIDFYIKGIDTYVQLDGVYWHGLNVPYEELRGTPKLKFDRDRACDEHFAATRRKLIRVTDIDVKEGRALDKL